MAWYLVMTKHYAGASIKFHILQYPFLFQVSDVIITLGTGDSEEINDKFEDNKFSDCQVRLAPDDEVFIELWKIPFQHLLKITKNLPLQ